MFAFGFEIRIETISPSINHVVISEALLVADHVLNHMPFQLSSPSLVSDKHVPACWFHSVSPCSAVGLLV